MSHIRRTGVVAVAAALTVALCGAAPAFASDASIRAAVRKAAPTINTDVANFRTAVAAYKSSGNVAGVRTAAQTLDSEFASLRAQISSQPATSSMVKTARQRLVKGLRQAIASYRAVTKALGEKAAGHNAAAKRNALKAIAAEEKATRNLNSGMKLLLRAK